MDGKSFGFIGAGFMAEAVLRGILEAKTFLPQAIVAADVAEVRRAVFSSLGVAATDDTMEIVKTCPTLLVAVKPKDLPSLLGTIGPELTNDHLILSICAGCSTDFFEASSSVDVRVVRAMPNLPLSVGMGATALCGGRYATAEDIELAKRVFGAGGEVVVVEEPLMDAVTAVSGSGPAYVYFLAEAMIEAGIEEGLALESARKLAVQTLRGAAAVLANDPASPEELRKRVTSKGGTTEAAFKVLTENSVRDSLIQAIRTAAARSRELGEGR